MQVVTIQHIPLEGSNLSCYHTHYVTDADEAVQYERKKRVNFKNWFTNLKEYRRVEKWSMNNIEFTMWIELKDTNKNG